MKTISTLSKANNRKNPTRSILIVIAVIISSLLLTAISMFGYSMVTFQQKNAEELYGSFYGIYAGVTDEQIEELNLRAEIHEIGKAANIGMVEGKGKRSVEWVSEKAQEMGNMERILKSGRFPEKENEILIQPEMLEELGYDNAEIGDEITVPFRRNQSEAFKDKTFVLSGIMKPMDVHTMTAHYTSYVSEAFYQKEYGKEERLYNAYFDLQGYLDLNSDSAKTLAKEIAVKCNIDSKQVVMNDYYLFWGLRPDSNVIFGCMGVAMLVILISIMVIYNIFHVGIQWKIREYGKIKALGATKKQMKQLILHEGLGLAIPAIPIGIILGVIFNFAFMNGYVKKIIKDVGVESGGISSFSVPILLLCFLLTLVTVIFSLVKPMKIVSKISPVEAIRYQEITKKSKGFRKGYKEMSWLRMLKANMDANKKHNSIIVIMLGISCVLFVMLGSVMSSISIEKETRRMIPYGDFEIQLDYSLDEEVYIENNLDNILKRNPLSEEIIDEIKNIDGVKEVKIQNILCGKDKEGKIYDISVADRDYLEKNIKNMGDSYGIVDYDKATKENALIYGGGHFYTESGYDFNDVVNLELIGRNEKKTYKGKMIGSIFCMTDNNWIMTEDTFENLNLDKNQETPGRIWITIDKEKEEKIGYELLNIVRKNNNLQMASFKEQYMLNEKAYNTMGILGYSLLFFIGMITFLNLVNSSLMNMITKKRELGIMQALGMTNKQLGKMLCSESLIMSVGSLVLALVVGLPLGYLIVCQGIKSGVFGLLEYHSPIVEVSVLIFVILFFQCILSFIISKNVKKESVIERIRYQE